MKKKEGGGKQKELTKQPGSVKCVAANLSILPEQLQTQKHLTC